MSTHRRSKRAIKLDGIGKYDQYEHSKQPREKEKERFKRKPYSINVKEKERN